LELSQELLRLILPEFLVNHFDLYDYKQQGEKRITHKSCGI
jgi:hypothetical protein